MHLTECVVLDDVTHIFIMQLYIAVFFIYLNRFYFFFTIVEMKINSSLISPLSGKTFVLELGHQIRFKAKQQLINYLQEQNAHISYILTASVRFTIDRFSY